MNKLETLLNTLIQMGWKPFDLTYITKCEVSDHGIYFYEGECSVAFCSYRELVSLESGLWQFCVEKGLVQKGLGFWRKGKKTIGTKAEIMQYQYKYRLLESALVPEEELGKFLVDNIAIGGKKE